MTTIAVIQPYFYPYAGYFRLFAAADVVVLFDCVQFPRRGWVHRNRFALASGELDWFTLPIAKAPQEAKIFELRFRPDVSERAANEMRRFPVIQRARDAREPLVERAFAFSGDDVTAYLCARVQETAHELGVGRPVVRSSTLKIAPELRGQDRVIEIVRRLGGTHYVNPSGGRDLYDHIAFNNVGLELRFLTTYEGSMESTLSRLLSEPVSRVSEEIRAQTILAA